MKNKIKLLPAALLAVVPFAVFAGGAAAETYDYYDYNYGIQYSFSYEYNTTYGYNDWGGYEESTGITITGFTLDDEYKYWDWITVAIPSEIGSYSVTKIDSCAFGGNDTIYGVQLPDGLTSIGYGAFENCDNLESITIPENVEEIYGDAFADCPRLSTITWKATNVSYAGSDVFENAGSNVGGAEFVLDCNAEYIPSDLFDNSGIKTVRITGNVSQITGNLFESESISSITVDGENNYYSSVDGNLYNKEQTELVRYAPGKTATAFEIPEKVTSIGSYAFSGCSVLTGVTIPEGVTSIGDRAFYGCTGLTDITIPEKVTSIGYDVFWNCNNLTSVTLNANTDSYSGDFLPSSLKTIYIGKNVTSIKSNIFSSLNNLTDITADGENKYFSSIDGNLYNKEQTELIKYAPGKTATAFEIPEKVTSIGNSAFSGCSGLTSVTIPSSVTTIGNYAFYNCTGLTGMTIPEGVTSIGEDTFSYCSGLTGVTLPESVTTIGGYAFYGCSKLASVTIPGNVEKIGGSAFYNCTKLASVNWNAVNAPQCGYNAFGNTAVETIHIGKNVKTINGYMFVGLDKLTSITADEENNNFSLIDGNLYKGQTELVKYIPKTSETSFTIPWEVTTIGDSAFYGCTGLTEMTIPENVTIIGNCAFYNCTGLTDIIFPEWVATIGVSAFYGCTGLTDVTIPEHVTTIGNSVFYNCTGLTNVYWNATYATVGSDVFRYAGRDSGGIDVVFGSDVLYIPENLFRDEFSYNYNYDSESYEYDSDGSIMLKSVTVGEYIVSIGDNAFYGCRKLENITWNTPYYADKAVFVCCGQDSGGINVVFGDCVTDIPNLLDSATASKVKTISAVGVTSIGERAFSGWSALERIDLTTAVTSIGDYAFEGCTALKSMTLPDVTEDFDRIYIPEEVTEIGKGAFRDCTALTAVILPDGITEIGENTFRGCTALTEINIPGGVTKIDRDAFNDCSSMKHVSIDDLAAWCGIEFKLGNDSPTISSPLSWGDVALYVNGELVTDLVIPEGVTSIGNYAFYGCGSIESITVPEGVEYVGCGAFGWCNKLTSVNWNAKNASSGENRWGYSYECIFYYAGSYEVGVDVVFGDKVESIPEDLFTESPYIKSVHIGKKVKTIGGKLFSYLKNTDITVDEENKYFSSVDENLYNKAQTALIKYMPGKTETSFEIPESVATIGDYAFYDCSGLTSITIPEGVTSIGDNAFSGCWGLTSVAIPESVTSVGNSAFSGCDSLEPIYITDLAAWCGIEFGNATANPLYYAEKLYINGELATDMAIPEGVTTIGSYAFSGCTGIKSVTIPEGVTTIGNGIFYNCTGLTSVTIPENVTTIGNSAFYGCSKLTSVAIPEGVTAIGNYAFYKCNKLTSVTIPESVTSINDYTFYKCTGLTSVTIPQGVTSIGKYAFYNCSGLMSITIPQGVTSIGKYAFYECNKLTSVTIPNSVTSIGTYAFRYNKSLTVYFIGTEAEWQNISGYRNVSAAKLVYTPRLCAEYTGDYIDTISVIKGEDVVLPVPPEGYVYRFTSNGEEWDGKNITSDVTVTVTKLCDMCDIVAVGDCRDLAVSDGKLTASTYFGTIECDKIELSEGAAAKVYGDETCSSDTLDAVPSDGSTVFIVVTAQSGRSATYAASFTHTPVADLGEIEFTYSAGGYVALRLKNEVPGEPKIFAAYSKNGEDYTYAETDYSRENGSFSISGLEEGTRYFVKAAADYRTGEYVYSDVIEFVTEKTLSNECEITKIVSPSIYDYDESAKTITAKAANRFAEYPVEVEVSDGATWGLYLSRNATLRLEGNKLPLAEGKYKTGYIKVLAGDGVTENIYTIKIYRQKKSAVPEIAVSDGNVTITAPEDTVVWYTTDNSTPVPNLCGKVYDGAFPAETGTVIKAIALNPGFEEYSDVAAFVVSSGEKAELELLELSIENSAAAFEYYLMTKDGSDLNGRFYFAAYGEKGRLLNVFDTPVAKSASECVMSGTLNVSEAPAYVKAFFWGGESGVEPLGKAVETPVGE